MLNKDRLKRAAVAVAKHISSNALPYVTLIEAITDDNYPKALTCLKVLMLRALSGVVQRKINSRKKDDDDTNH